MGWELFEQLVVSLAFRLDGAYAAYRYGNPGQRQHGLDVIALIPGRRPSGYQAKRWQEFGAADLEDAVVKYAEGQRPFNVERVVVAVASEVRETSVLEKLGELQGRYPDLQIELWDRRQISERLRSHADIVGRHFSSATAEAFCDRAPTPAPVAAPSITADAVLRGPITHLGMADALRRAEEITKERPHDAAELLAEIADRLESQRFIPHAAPVRELQARALRSAGRRVEESWVRIDLGWRQLEARDTFSAEGQIRQVSEWTEAPADIVRCANALSVSVDLRRTYAISLDVVGDVFDTLEEGDPHRAAAALVLAEEAVANGRFELVRTRASRMEALAASLPGDSDGELTAARLRMCLADCCGGWEALARRAREVYSPKVTALMLARFARHLTLALRPEESFAGWRDAIERACNEGLNDDAADWLHALQAAQVVSGMVDPQINELHRHALALRAAGSGTILPEPYSARERGLAELRDQDWPDALEELRRYLWHSTISADLQGERDAHDLLGDVFVATHRGYEAIRHYVASGNAGKLEEFASALDDEPVCPSPDLASEKPWEREAAFKFVAACADLIPDDAAREWCTLAFSEIASGEQPTLLFGPHPRLAAFKAFGQLAIVSSEEQGRRFLEISESLIPREPMHYRFTDEGQTNALIGIARAHPSLRSQAIDQLLQALLADQRMADIVLREADDLIRGNPDRTVAAVVEAAAAGHEHAAFALLVAEADPTHVAPIARRRLEQVSVPRVHKPGERSMRAGLGQIAGLVTVLPQEDRERFARVMLEVAKDRNEMVSSRCDALKTIIAIGRRLSDATRDELFGEVLSFAEGKHSADLEHELFPGATDPLSRFRFVIDDTSLASAGLRALAAFARSTEQYGTVQSLALAQLPGASDVEANSIAHALASIPADEVTLAIDVLASHSSQWVRSVAAVLWAQRADASEEIGLRLAQDPSPHVRVSLASAVTDDPRHEKVRAELAGDVRRSVRQRVRPS